MNWQQKLGELGGIVHILDDDPSQKSYLLAYSLLVLGGRQGLHHFYLENWFLGSLWAMTGALAGGGLLVDFFLLPIHVFVYNNLRSRR